MMEEREHRRPGGPKPATVSGPPEDPRDARPDTREPGYRQRRRAELKARRQRRLVRAAAVVSALLVMVAIFAVLRSMGGEGDDEPVSGPAGAAPSAGGLLVAIEEEGVVRAAALVRGEGTQGLILGLPRNTLLQAESGFEALDVLHERNREEAVAALGRLVGEPPEHYARISWTELRRRAQEAAEEGNELPESLAVDDRLGSDSAARALVWLAGPGEAARRGTGDLSAEEGEAELRSSLEGLRGGVEEARTLPGRLVEGIGFVYFEPDLVAVRALLGTASDDATEVEVQNGSGAVGVVEAVSERLEPLGYHLLPSRNADRFPDVENTQVFAARDALAEGERVREVLGTGRLIPQDGLPSGRIVVVVGGDLTVEQLREGADR
jgi:hypothetical protein